MATLIFIIILIAFIIGIVTVMSAYDQMKEAEKIVSKDEKRVYEEGRKLGMTDEEITQDLKSKGLK